MSVRRVLAGSIGVLLLAGCGSDPDAAIAPASTVDSTTATPTTSGTTAVTAPPTAPATAPPTTSPATSPAPVPAAVPSDGLQLCSEVPPIETAIIGDDASGLGPDPVFLGVLQTYALEHPDTFGGIWIDREANGTIVVAFTDDPLPHLEALAARRPSPDDAQPVEPPLPITDDRPIGEWDVAFDVVRVTYTEAELNARQTDIVRVLNELGLGGVGAGSSLTNNRVSVFVADAVTAELAATMETAIEAVAPLGIVCLEGTIVESPPATIAPGSPLDVIVLPDDSGSYPSDTPVQCGGVAFTLGDLASLTPIEEADPGLRAVVEGWIGGGGAGMGPPDGWVVLTQTDALATMVAISDGGMAVIGAEMGRNGWIWSGASSGGPCDVARLLPAGMGQVEWVLDPAFPAPDATSTDLHVLVTETACTGGSEIGDRLLGPQVVETDDAVRVAFASIALTGAQACPGNPSTPVTITLAQPLGTRALLDGLTVAPLGALVSDT